MNREQKIVRIRKILAENNITKAYFFGSFARKEKKYKDIDIAIVLPKTPLSLFDISGMELEIEEKTGKKADISVLSSIKPRIMKYVEKDLVAVA